MTAPHERHDPDDLAFPRQLARTRSFACGRPRRFGVSPDGARVVFLRSSAGDDPANRLWVLDCASGEERVVYDPRETGSGEPELTDAERARRERARETTGGVVAYATDRDVTKAVFVDGGRLHLADLSSGDVVDIRTPGVPDDPRLDPTGARISYVVDGSLHVQEIGGVGRVLAGDDEPNVHWGLPEFIAAEEMGRMRGHWWSPDGTKLAACRVDERPVQVWWITDPTDPAAEPRPMRYPSAGTPNALVTLHVFDVATGGSVEVTWDASAFEYLSAVAWDEGAPLTLLVQSRDQRVARFLAADELTGVTTMLREDVDEHWIELVPGTPTYLPDGRLVSTVDADGARRLAVEGEPVTPPGLDVASVLTADATGVVFTGSEHEAPEQTHVWRVRSDGTLDRLTTEPGLHTAATGGEVAVVISSLADAVEPVVSVRRHGEVVATIASVGETPILDPRPTFTVIGERQLRSALVLPRGASPGDVPDGTSFPVLLAPYGGPHAREVERTRGAFLTACFYADRLGVAVLVIDGRGTPGRGTAWEREVAGDFTVTLEDQVDGLHAAAERWPFLDLERVAMIGWSFGGLLSALAVVDRPDAVHAAVIGAPVTDARLYDTHYTERYLGAPTEHAEAYDRSSPLTRASPLTHPTLTLHGLADDNVVAANALRFSTALFAAGVPHELVLLPNASHIGGFDELVIGRYLAVLDFLRRHLVERRAS
ncbi:MAG TPA: DPP IV N-terminal domain-containing protein [Actinomycetota bacterium]|nr:DPP IV N-terminal domain-containing protein [Actinomycetota bacterium]